MAGIRCGFAVCCAPLAERLRKNLPAWNVNVFAAAAVRAILKQPSSWAEQERTLNRERRKDLFHRLSALPGAAVLPSCANFLLFRLSGAPSGLASLLLKKHGIAVRDCSNYPGLETGGWFRAGVRTPEEHELLERALRVELDKHAPAILRRPPKSALMIQGTCSDAGKSVLTAALCRIFHQDGFSVAPFKAQNMALNSGVTALGEEMGRAQMVQAQAWPDRSGRPDESHPAQTPLQHGFPGHRDGKGGRAHGSRGILHGQAPVLAGRPRRLRLPLGRIRPGLPGRGRKSGGNQPEIRGRGQHEHGPLRPR